MNIHNNARLTPKGREILISRLERGEHPGDVAGAMGVSVRTVYKWRQRFRNDEGRRDVAREHGEHVLDAQRYGLSQRRAVVRIPQLFRRPNCL